MLSTYIIFDKTSQILIIILDRCPNYFKSPSLLHQRHLYQTFPISGDTYRHLSWQNLTSRALLEWYRSKSNQIMVVNSKRDQFLGLSVLDSALERSITQNLAHFVYTWVRSYIYGQNKRFKIFILYFLLHISLILFINQVNDI